MSCLMILLVFGFFNLFYTYLFLFLAYKLPEEDKMSNLPDPLHSILVYMSSDEFSVML